LRFAGSARPKTERFGVRDVARNLDRGEDLLPEHLGPIEVGRQAMIAVLDKIRNMDQELGHPYINLHRESVAMAHEIRDFLNMAATGLGRRGPSDSIWGISKVLLALGKTATDLL
jgi:hypothetical protein